MPAPPPVLLAPDNFTPPSRTPWGGTKIIERYKADLALRGDALVVGESWEVSVEPDFPSVVDGSGETLAMLIACDAASWVGREARVGRTSTALLVKLLDAADDLSVQIHPSDDYAALAPGEAGKPESWYVLEREPGAGFYLGLREGVTATVMKDILDNGGDVSALLGFVPVEPGDFFVIEAGTPHAVGRGVTLVEPQHVAPGKRGVTYRYWDWNRRYDAAGKRDDAGTPRALHVADALAVTDWAAPRGDAFLGRVRHRAGAAQLDLPARFEALSGPGAPLASAHLEVGRLAGTGEVALPNLDALRALTVVAGAMELAFAGGTLRVERGRSAVIPAAASSLVARLEGACALMAAIADPNAI